MTPAAFKRSIRDLQVWCSARGLRGLRFPKVHPAEISKGLLETLGFRAGGGHRLYAATPRAD